MKNGILVFLIGLLIACTIVVVKNKKAAAAYADAVSETTEAADVPDVPAELPAEQPAEAGQPAIEDTTAHLAFKGVPITGTLKQYVTRMKAAGFRSVDADAHCALLTGDFAGYTDCTVQVSTLKALDVVSMIAVMFPSKDKWPELSNNYKRIKSLLTKKYGAPASCTEKFNTSFAPQSDHDRMFGVNMDECQYITTYRTRLGVIRLSIATGFNPYVMLIYQDKANSGKVEQQAYDDL